jgi:hypothetical protein
VIQEISSTKKINTRKTDVPPKPLRKAGKYRKAGRGGQSPLYSGGTLCYRVFLSMNYGFVPVRWRNTMSFQSVKAFFEENGHEFDVRKFTTSTENVELAARALGVEPSLIAKTLAFKGRNRDILVVMKGDAKVDNK